MRIELSLGRSNIHEGSPVVIWHQMDPTKVFKQPIKIIFCLTTHIFLPEIYYIFFFFHRTYESTNLTRVLYWNLSFLLMKLLLLNNWFLSRNKIYLFTVLQIGIIFIIREFIIFFSALFEVTLWTCLNWVKRIIIFLSFKF